MKLYLAVTTDRLELPIYVCDTSGELADHFGVTRNVVLSSISHNWNGKNKGFKFIRVEIEE